MNQKGLANIILVGIIILVALVFLWPKEYRPRYSYLDESGDKAAREYVCFGFTYTSGGGELPGDPGLTHYCLGFPFQKSTIPQDAQTTQTPTPTPAPIDPTANWKTYTNTQYGFEVKIPTDWTVDGSSSANELFFYSSISKKENDARASRCKDPAVRENEALECSQRNIDMYFTNTTYGNNGNKKEVINGVTWTVLEGENSGWQYEAKQNGKSYHFALTYLPENKGRLVEFLSTFKFTK